MPSLFLVHCGFYDLELSDGIYESHVNFFVVADDFDDAKARAKELPEYKARRMHVDGLQRIDAVQGFRVVLKPDAGLRGETQVLGNRHRDLAPKKSP